MKTKNVGANPVCFSRGRVKELAVRRLEALTEKQRVRQFKVSPRLPSVNVRTKAKKTHLAATAALDETRRKKEPLAVQLRGLAGSLCLYALVHKRPALTPGIETAFLCRMVEREKMSAEGGLPPRVRETGPALRSLRRAEALLTRLVWAWAEAEARKEASEG